jgi:hypothetical protein
MAVMGAEVEGRLLEEEILLQLVTGQLRGRDAFEFEEGVGLVFL